MSTQGSAQTTFGRAVTPIRKHSQTSSRHQKKRKIFASKSMRMQLCSVSKKKTVGESIIFFDFQKNMIVCVHISFRCFVVWQDLSTQLSDSSKSSVFNADVKQLQTQLDEKNRVSKDLNILSSGKTRFWARSLGLN